MMDHLANEENIRLWFAFAVDYEDHYECARAATGCLAMATQDRRIAQVIIRLDKFKVHIMTLLESGRLEIMHRAFVMVYNLVTIVHSPPQDDSVDGENPLHDKDSYDALRETLMNQTGIVDFCRAYIELQQHAGGGADHDFSKEERQLIPITVEIAKKIVQLAD
jgi:protein unc-45